MKKMISFLLAALTLAFMLPLTAMAQTFEHEETFTIGDADGDGEVNMLDLFSLKRYLSGYQNENRKKQPTDGEYLHRTAECRDRCL